MKTALVLGAGGFIGHHMVTRLKAEGFWVRGIDLKFPEYEHTRADEFIIFDLRRYSGLEQLMTTPKGLAFDQIYQFAADMGGAGYLFTGEHDFEVMHNSGQINMNVLEVQRRINLATKTNTTTIFYSSSACMYPEYNQTDPENPICEESSAYPAQPDSEYGWEKLFSERMYFAANRNLQIPVRVARYHNVFGPLGTWTGGREKSPAAICRKVAEAAQGGDVEIWGDGEQTRSFLYIDECIEATRRFVESDFVGPVNIGSEEMVTINQMAAMIANIANKTVNLKHDLSNRALGVRGRKSDNSLYLEKVGWVVSMPLGVGLEKTYRWIEEQVKIRNTQ